MNAEQIMNQITDLNKVKYKREVMLKAVRDVIIEHDVAIARLEARAAKWELGIDAVEAQIEDLTRNLEEYPLDMTPTGEGEDEGEDWEAAGFTVQ